MHYLIFTLFLYSSKGLSLATVTDTIFNPKFDAIFYYSNKPYMDYARNRTIFAFLTLRITHLFALFRLLMIFRAGLINSEINYFATILAVYDMLKEDS